MATYLEQKYANYKEQSIYFMLLQKRVLMHYLINQYLHF